MGQHLRGSAAGGLSAADAAVAHITVHITIHGLDHAVAALRAAAGCRRPVVLLSAPGAGAYAGALWFAALLHAAAAAVPGARCNAVLGDAVLDCADDPVAAMAAVEAGIGRIVYTGRADVAARLAGIAAARGARLERRRPASHLDLADDFFAGADALERRCTEGLAASSAQIIGDQPAIC